MTAAWRTGEILPKGPDSNGSIPSPISRLITLVGSRPANCGLAAPGASSKIRSSLALTSDKSAALASQPVDIARCTPGLLQSCSVSCPYQYQTFTYLSIYCLLAPALIFFTHQETHPACSFDRFLSPVALFFYVIPYSFFSLSLGNYF